MYRVIVIEENVEYLKYMRQRVLHFKRISETGNLCDSEEISLNQLLG